VVEKVEESKKEVIKHFDERFQAFFGPVPEGVTLEELEHELKHNADTGRYRQTRNSNIRDSIKKLKSDEKKRKLDEKKAAKQHKLDEKKRKLDEKAQEAVVSDVAQEAQEAVVSAHAGIDITAEYKRKRAKEIEAEETDEETEEAEEPDVLIDNAVKKATEPDILIENAIEKATVPVGKLMNIALNYPTHFDDGPGEVKIANGKHFCDSCKGVMHPCKFRKCTNT
jgi:hypothetical protein